MNALSDLFSQAVAIQQTGRHDLAAPLYRSILVQVPDHAMSLANLGIAEAEQRNLGGGLLLINRALRMAPDQEDVRRQRDALLRRARYFAVTHYNANRIPEALQAIRHALRHGADTLNNRAIHARLLGEIGDMRGAVIEYDRLFAALRDPASPDGAPALDPAAGPGMEVVWSDTLLLGWSLHMILGDEAGVDRLARRAPPFILSDRPIWDGTPVPGARLLYALDMGFGDAFQYIRHAATIKALGMSAIVLCSPKVARILRSCPFIDRIVVSGEAMPDHDAWLLNSHHGDRVSAHGELGVVFPYLHAEPELQSAWAARLGPSRRLRIVTNLSASSPLRDMPVSILEEFAGIDGVEILDITKSGTALPALRNGPLPPNVRHIGDQLDNGPDAFIETAAVLGMADLVITTDTSIAHLAGALGRPVWMFLRMMADCRWGAPDRPLSHYPTMRPFRQTVPGSWTDILDRMKRDLIGMVESRNGSVSPTPFPSP